MKTKILHYLSATAYGASFVAGLNLAGVTAFLPPHIAKPVMLVPPILGALAHSVLAIGDVLDDGEKNGSFKCAPFALLAALALALLCPSCATTTTTPSGGTVVEKTDSEAIGVLGGVIVRIIEAFTPSQPAPAAVTPAK